MAATEFKSSKKLKRQFDRPNGPIAVVDVGATSLRMAIAQVNSDGKIEQLDSLHQAVNLGKDSFIKGRIEHRTIEDCVRVLKIFRHKLDEYEITDPRSVRIVATSAVREATNRVAFLDRIFIATGFDVEPFDEAELHRVTYLSIHPVLERSPALPEDATVVCEVGGGSTEVLVLDAGDITFSQTYRLGSLRLRKTLEALDAPQVKVREIMDQQIDQTVQQIRKAVPKGRSVNLVGMGGDLRFAVSELDPEWERSELAELKTADFRSLTEEVLDLNVDQICQRYHLSFPEAETLGPAMLTNLHIADALGVETIRVANTNLRDGLLNEMSQRSNWAGQFQKQVVRYALDLGRRFKFDEPHAIHVAELSGKLFDDLADEHQLSSRFRTILYVAALLHEIGQFVSNRSYHKHTMYLIQNSQFFGLGRRDLQLTSLVSRYHRRAHPLPTHSGFKDLRRKDRVAVSKLSAILRIGIALDESRSQRLKEIETRVIDDRVVISVENVSDLSLEQVALRQFGPLFQEVYGKRVVVGHA